ncbi:hypothetical protein PHISP_02882 [Aspergillus sp. HF37]|nr:hypothetical protein PHISP_02882 [Aspergillus sp. HF37]
MVSQNNPPIGKLPKELFLSIAEDLDPQSLTNLQQVCKSVYIHLRPTVQKAAQKHALPSDEVYAQRFVGQPNGSLRVVPCANLPLPRERLVDAIRSNRINIVNCYLQAGVDPNAYCLYGARLLSISIRSIRPQITNLLISHGANPSLPNPVNSITPLTQAVRVADSFTSNNFVVTLVAAGADVTPQGAIHEIVRRCPTSTVHLALAHGANLHQLDRDGSTTIHAASCAYGMVDAQKLTHITEAVPNLLPARTITGETAFCGAIRTGRESFALAFLSTILRVSRDPLDVLDSGRAGLTGEFALHLAIKSHMPDLCLQLIDAGVTIDRFAYWGTELHYAVKYRLRRVVEKLLAAGADVNANAGGGSFYTPLMYAVETGDAALVQLLAHRPEADLGIGNRLGATALMIARDREYGYIASYLEALGG